MHIPTKISTYWLRSFIIVGILLFAPSLFNISLANLSILGLFSFFILLSLYRGKIDSPQKKIFLFILTLLIIIILYSFFNYAYIIPNDTYMLSKSFYMLICFILSYFVAIRFFNRDDSPDVFFEVLFVLTTLHTLFIFMLAASDSLLMFFRSLHGGYDFRGRLFGLNGMAGAHLSVLHFFGAVAFFYAKRINLFIRIIMLLTIFAGLVYIGRTGMLFFMLLLIAQFIVYIIRRFGVMGFLVGSVSFFYILFIIVQIIYTYFDFLPTNIYRALSFIKYMIENDTYMPPTVEVLLSNHYFLPHTDEAFWLGQLGVKLFDENTLGYRSDVGYVKFIFSVGFIGLLLYMFFYLALLIIAKFFLKYSSFLSFPIIAILSLFVFHAKEIAFGNIPFSIIIFLSFFIPLIKITRHKERNQS